MGRLLRVIPACLTITLVLGLGFVVAGVATPQAEAAALCPATANLTNNNCDVTFTINANGTVTQNNVSSTPYDGADDQLIGIIDNYMGGSVSSIQLSGPAGLFGFDGDGICTYAPGNGFGNAAATPAGILSYCSASQIAGTDPLDYAGPDNTFSGINGSQSMGTVNFTSPLTAGVQTFFSLELAPSGGTIGVIVNPTPEPSTLALLGSVGLGMVPFLRKRSASKKK